MARWVEFTADHDYKHESRAITAYKAGDIVYVPDHIIENLPKGVYKDATKPVNADGHKRSERVQVIDPAPPQDLYRPQKQDENPDKI